MRLRFRFASPALLTALVLLAACSGGDGSSGASTTAASTSLPPTTEATTTTTEPTFTGANSEQFCNDDRTARAQLAQIGSTGADALKNRYTGTADALRALVVVAPDEILPDLRVLSQAYDAFVASMQQSNWDQSRILGEVSQKLGTAEVKTSADRLQAYERKVCGITS